MTEEASRRGAPANVRDLLARIDAGWRALMAALDDIPDERLEEPGAVGDWSLKNLFGHIAFWDSIAIDDAEKALAGQTDPRDDFQAMNEADHEARLGRTLPEERAAMHQAHAALIDYLDDIPGLDAARLDEAIKGDTYEHYEEHTADILAWRKRTGV